MSKIIEFVIALRRLEEAQQEWQKAIDSCEYDVEYYRSGELRNLKIAETEANNLFNSMVEDAIKRHNGE